MPEIKDSGKVWMKGSFIPVKAVRIDNKIFATGQKEDQSAELWLEEEGLCLDLHDFKKGERTARFIPLNSKAELPGTLFNGFEKTKHSDVLVVACNVIGSKEKSVSGIKYQDGNFNALDHRSFWQAIWKPELRNSKL